MVYRKCNIEKLEQVQHRATRLILCQRRGEQSYEERLCTLELIKLSHRRTYISICFACSCLISTHVFYFCRWNVNTRHGGLIFKQEITAKTDAFKNSLLVCFPAIWSNINNDVRNSLVTCTFATFKKQLRAFLNNIS